MITENSLYYWLQKLCNQEAQAHKLKSKPYWRDIEFITREQK